MPITREFLTQVFDAQESVTSSKLLALSTLADTETQAFKESWDQAPGSARVKLLDRLIDIAEDNVEADFDAIFRVALEDAAPAIRERAIDALWECQDRWLLNRLAEMAEADPAEDVRAAATAALGKFVLLGVLEELRPSLVDKVEGVLKRIIGNLDDPVSVRRRAIEALSPSGDPDMNDVIRDAYHSEERDLRISAVFAMGQHCDDGWLPVLLSELKSTDSAMRFEAARACGELEDERAVPSLIQLTRETDAEIQEAAIEALGRIGGDEARAALQRCVKASDQRIRDAASAALDELALRDNPLRDNPLGFG